MQVALWPALQLLVIRCNNGHAAGGYPQRLRVNTIFGIFTYYATFNLSVYESFAIYQSKTIFTPLFSVQNCAWYSGLNFGYLLRRTSSVHGKNVQTFSSLRS